MDTMTYIGHDVSDEHGDTVGTVSDVFFDDVSKKPKWLVVNPGLLRKERLVPFAGSYETDDGKLMIPFDKKWIKQAPAVDGDHYPDQGARQHAAQHFGVAG